MRARLVVLTAVLLGAFAVPGLAAAREGAAPSPCASGKVTKTASYRLALVLGPRQEMYMPSEVRSRKITKGQVMLDGEMVMLDRTPAGTRIYNLEVHICTKSGAVVTRLKPTIVVKDPKAKRLPVAMMASVAKGLGDYHYGNDVALTPGRRIAVTVTVKGERAVFHATVPRKS